MGQVGLRHGRGYSRVERVKVWNGEIREEVMEGLGETGGETREGNGDEVSRT